MKKILLLLMLTITFATSRSYATTWDEPWADKVIKDATSFVLAKVVATDEQRGITLQVIKTLGGQPLKDNLTITGFYLLHLCSTSAGHGPEFYTTPTDSCYFFIQQNKAGNYCIATPTTGYDYAENGNVRATFRHSYHQALAPVAVYEKTMTAIFNNYHGAPYDQAYISSFVKEQLSKKPAGFGEDEIHTFFLQHVALECVHHLKLNTGESLILPFLEDSKNFHNQVSAARAMAAFNTAGSKEALLKVIGDTTRRGFVQVMCVWSLGEMNAQSIKPQLEALVKHANEEEDDFGGNIMDPRICTDVPSVKEALESLIAKLG
ncbi:MAG TPA: HEAT repeat domain-containing protein [Chitinophaga sp.]|uniref:HEAT repeat domain-containing protein n=1 Tax=Chitinophaga sp. TaxID=1869181 RepID=UPI002DBED61D|nr:HEAT repeat domain-containing protein [Chitinophaga sp.]HEU4551943.1 HEAT repeat domain-containing protein [Chitinophaga sp.]